MLRRRRMSGMLMWPAMAMAAIGSTLLYFTAKRAASRERDAKLDAMSEDSFPASDAPAY